MGLSKCYWTKCMKFKNVSRIETVLKQPLHHNVSLSLWAPAYHVMDIIKYFGQFASKPGALLRSWVGSTSVHWCSAQVTCNLSASGCNINYQLTKQTCWPTGQKPFYSCMYSDCVVVESYESKQRCQSQNLVTTTQNAMHQCNIDYHFYFSISFPTLSLGINQQFM